MLSPIIIDVGGHGFSLTDAEHGVVFDLAAKGRPGKLAWTAEGADNAFLVLDRNRNGVIDDGAELFGSMTSQPNPVPPQKVNGFAALAVFDANGDRQITSNDQIWGQLRLWRDANHNGLTERDELLTPDAVGLIVIGLDYRESRRKDRFGNEFRYSSMVTFDQRAGRRTGIAYDVFLVGQ